MDKQIFGYTEPGMPAEGYVQFAQAFVVDGQGVKLAIRNSAGQINEIVVPAEKAAELRDALAAI